MAEKQKQNCSPGSSRTRVKRAVIEERRLHVGVEKNVVQVIFGTFSCKYPVNQTLTHVAPPKKGSRGVY